MRSLKELDKAASVLADACRMLLDPELPDGELRGLVYDSVGQDELVQALADVTGLGRPDDAVFYQELSARAATVARFLPTLLRVIQFDANPAAFHRRRGPTAQYPAAAQSRRRPTRPGA